MQKGTLPYNPKNQNNARPMALEQNFKDHNKTSYPFHAEFPAIKKTPRSFKVHLNSQDKDAGTISAATFNVSLPDAFINKRLNIVVDAVCHSLAPNANGNLDIYPYYVRISELKNPYSYSSTMKGTTSAIALCQGKQWFSHQQRDIGGSTLVDWTLFQRPITIEFYSPHFTASAAGGVVNEWSLSMTVYDAAE
jgi:hypothetical protein